MKKSNGKKGFTLVELIVVIAVIGILAAVLIPTFGNIIQKARYQSDVTDVANMNKILATEAVGLDMSKLSDSEVRYLVNRGEKNYTFVPKSKGATYWYDIEQGKILLSQMESTVSSVAFAATVTPENPNQIAEVYPGKLYLNTKGDLANAINKLRNLSDLTSFISLCSNPVFEGIDFSNILKEFNPIETIFINNLTGFTSSTELSRVQTALNSLSGTQKTLTGSISNFVFADNISVIPNLESAFGNQSVAANLNVYIPTTVKVVRNGAFSKFDTQLNVRFNSTSKLQIVEGAFNAATLDKSGFVENISITDFESRVVQGNQLIKVNYYTENNGSQVQRTAQITEGVSILTIPKNLKNEGPVVRSKPINVDTSVLMAAFPNITVLNIKNYPSSTNPDLLTISVNAFDNQGAVVSMTIQVTYKANN